MTDIQLKDSNSDLFGFSSEYVSDSIFKFDIDSPIQEERFNDFVKWCERFENDHEKIFSIWYGIYRPSCFKKEVGKSGLELIEMANRRQKVYERYMDYVTPILKKLM